MNTYTQHITFLEKNKNMKWINKILRKLSQKFQLNSLKNLQQYRLVSKSAMFWYYFLSLLLVVTIVVLVAAVVVVVVLFLYSSINRNSGSLTLRAASERTTRAWANRGRAERCVVVEAANQRSLCGVNGHSASAPLAACMCRAAVYRNKETVATSLKQK